MFFIRHVRLVTLASLCIVATGPASADQRTAAKSAARAVIGNTVHGGVSAGEFYDYYMPNGSVMLRSVRGDTTQGRWTIENDNLCIDYPGNTKACYEVRRKGRSFDMINISSGEIFHDRLLRGNPRHL